MSVSASLGEGWIGSTMDESEYDRALLESGGTSNGFYPLVLHVNLEGWLAREGVGRVFLPLPLVAMPFPEFSTSGTISAALMMS